MCSNFIIRSIILLIQNAVMYCAGLFFFVLDLVPRILALLASLVRIRPVQARQHIAEPAECRNEQRERGQKKEMFDKYELR